MECINIRNCYVVALVLNIMQMLEMMLSSILTVAVAV